MQRLFTRPLLKTVRKKIGLKTAIGSIFDFSAHCQVTIFWGQSQNIVTFIGPTPLIPLLKHRYWIYNKGLRILAILAYKLKLLNIYR
jgi:hypothetical protein